MKKLLFVCFLSICSLFAYAEPPIQVLYWQSSDVPAPSQKELDSFNDVMKSAQSFFASQMNFHGFGEKTFAFKNIEVFRAKEDVRYYAPDQWRIADEAGFIQRGWDRQIWVVFFVGSDSIDGSYGVAQYLCPAGGRLQDCNNLVVVTTANDRLLLPLVAHEMAHAFNLIDHADEMWVDLKINLMHHPLVLFGGGVKMYLKDYAFSKKDAAFLNNVGRLAVQEDNAEIIFSTDVNRDGKTDLSDVLIVKSGMQNSIFYDTDVNNDGVTDDTDLALVKLKAVEAIVAAAPSHPSGITTTWGGIKKR